MNNPAILLQAIFENIATTRMAGIPILNPALHVEAVGFREWEGHWIGVLVTPWMINLVLMAGEELPLVPLHQGENQTWHFPSGAYEFMGLNEPELGTCHICPLISPVAEFATHEDAVAVAREVAESLFRQTKSDQIRDAELTDELEEARLKGESLTKRDMSRRDFLRLPFLGR
jgi:[NiFe] hydrogenase assembly HybE family chaperone